VNVPEAELTDLRGRINTAKWPERETVADDSQGVPLAMMQELAHYWAADYDWRACEPPVTSAVLGHASHGHPAGDLTRDDVLDNITLYWLTGTAVSSARLYWENKLSLCGHFAAWEQPKLWSEEVRAGFRPLRK
jgi:hypothetical protein